MLYLFFKNHYSVLGVVIAIVLIGITTLCATIVLKEDSEIPSDLSTQTERYGETTATDSFLVNHETDAATMPVTEEKGTPSAPKAEEEVLSIYRCTDNYYTDQTPTHGTGSISVPLDESRYQVSSCMLRLCDDGCDPEHIVNRAAQGYAPVYKIAQSKEYSESDGWNYHTRKFIMEVPEQMIEDLQRQGMLESVLSELEREYYYLLTQDETHYAYIKIVPKDKAAEKPSDEDAVVDEFVKNAVVRFTLDVTP